VQGDNLVLTVVPEPSTLALLVAGAVGIAEFGWQKRKSCGPKVRAFFKRRAEPW
jgi:hypothetical protein